MPIWGVWLDDRFCFSTGAESAKARNLAANSYCVIVPERADDAVIVEGVAEKATDSAFLERANDAYYAKYRYKLDPSLGPIFVVRPRIAFGIVEYQLTETATRWVFPRQ